MQAAIRVIPDRLIIQAGELVERVARDKYILPGVHGDRRRAIDSASPTRISRNPLLEARWAVFHRDKVARRVDPEAPACDVGCTILIKGDGGSEI